MIIGVGIDVCDVARFAESVARRPGLVNRLFTAREAERPMASQAARFAAKEALAKALGDKKGIARYGFAYLPMDETLTRVALDVSGRPFLVWKVDFTRSKIGEMDTELFREWFQAFAQHAGLTLHVETLYGENSHHIAETCYKALARALRQAVAIDERQGARVPSTKGQL